MVNELCKKEKKKKQEVTYKNQIDSSAAVSDRVCHKT